MRNDFSTGRLFWPQYPTIFILCLSHCIHAPTTCSCPWETVVLLGDYGEMPHLFVFTSFSHSALLLFSVSKSVDVFALFMCVCVMKPEHTSCLRTLLPQYQPLLQRYLPPPLISALVCLPSQHLVHNLPTSSYFTPGVQQHRTRVRRLPSSHLYSLTLPERDTRTQTLNTRTVFLYYLICNGAGVVG